MQKLFFILAVTAGLHVSSYSHADSFFEAHNIPFTKTLGRNENAKEDLTTGTSYLKIEIGPLTKEQFEQSKTHFKSDPNLSFNPRKKYLLEEFLPAPISALLGRSLKPQEEIKNPWISSYFKRLRQRVSNSNINGDGTNCSSCCFTSAWEFVRAFQRASQSPEATPEFSIWNHSRSTVFDTLTSDTYTAPVENSEDLRPGDLILFANSLKPRNDLYGKEIIESYLLHAVVYIDDDIILEKTDTEYPNMYRFASLAETEKQIQKIISEEDPRAIGGKGTYKKLVRSTNRDRNPGIRTLPAVHEIFTIARDKNLSAAFKKSVSQNGLSDHLYSSVDSGGGTWSETPSFGRILPLSFIRGSRGWVLNPDNPYSDEIEPQSIRFQNSKKPMLKCGGSLAAVPAPAK